MPETHIVVCTTCRAPGTSREQAADGLSLFAAVQQALWEAENAGGAPLNLRLRGQACMSGCNRACTLAVQALGKWTYYWGDLAPDAATAAQIVVCARMHERSADGELAWKDRPKGLQSGVLARLPAVAAASVAQRV